MRESRRLWAEALGGAAQLGPPAWQAAIRIQQAAVEGLLGDPRKARSAAEAALAIERTPATLLTAAMVLAIDGETDRATALLDEAAGAPPDGLCLRRSSTAIGRALVEALSGRAASALDSIRAVAPFERGRNLDLGPLAIRASIEAQLGRPADAAATCQQLLRLRRVSPTSPWIPVARLTLARALRDRGDIDGSRAAYTALLESMKDADADAPLLLTARRERDGLPDRAKPEAVGRAITGRR
jgi:tetratricopeptide (TPR) repeat protein